MLLNVFIRVDLSIVFDKISLFVFISPIFNLSVQKTKQVAFVLSVGFKPFILFALVRK